MILRGVRDDVEQGDTLTVTGRIRCIIHPASVVNGMKVLKWVEE